MTKGRHKETFAERDEEVVYELGALLAYAQRPVRDPKARARLDAVLDELERRGVLREDDDRGFGWRVIVDGLGVLPRKEMIFRAKGHAWLCWFGMGRPGQARLIATADPTIDFREMEAEGPVEVGEISVVRTPPKLTVVKG